MPAEIVAAQTGTADPLCQSQAGTPVQIEATQGIEWRRNDKTYIARGDATATRGDLKVRADTLTRPLSRQGRWRHRDLSDRGRWRRGADPARAAPIYGSHAVYNLDNRVS